MPQGPMALLKRIPVYGILLAVLAACSMAPSPAERTSPKPAAPDKIAKRPPIAIPTVVAPNKSIAAAIVTVNRLRARQGRRPVRYHGQLNKAAYGHAKAMAVQDFFSHTGPKGSTMGRRVTQTGYIWGLVAENISAGQKTPFETVETWMDSPGHRRNILMKGVVHIGFAHFKRDPDPGDVIFKDYWVMVLAAPQ
jgi:uncharacterized protein YkwD